MAELALEFADGVSGPDTDSFQRWVDAVLSERPEAQLCIRVVDETEGGALNRDYRGKEGATNVLSFPAELPDGVDVPLLGDIVICAPVVRREAAEQGKDEGAHWAHMVIHGTLHLLGMDHQDEAEAAAMESLETVTMRGLGYPDPYAEDAAPSPAVG